MANDDSSSSTVSNDQLVRGETPADIEQRCLELCQAYLGGSWQHAKKPSDIAVTRITGGQTNQLYRVQLSASVKRVSNPVYADEPTDVAVKLYQKKHMTSEEDANERLSDTIVLTIMSQTGLGPPVYGIFKDGNIQAFLEVCCVLFGKVESPYKDDKNK